MTVSDTSSKYTFELWTVDGRQLADFNGRAKQRRITASRNDAELIEWQVDLDEFEAYCRSQGLRAAELLLAGSTEIRIKRKDKYLVGGIIEYVLPAISASGGSIEIRASGFLNYFRDRFTGSTPSGTVTEDYPLTSAGSIASQLITQTQALTNGDVGVTVGTVADSEIVGRFYQRTRLKDAIQDLTKISVAPLDFEFTFDKVFNTYVQIGTNRPDIVFEYPGNIRELEAPTDATSVDNEAIAQGSGFGTEAGAEAVVDDLGSQATYHLRQNVVTSNAVDDEFGELTDFGNSELAAWSFPFQIPTLTLNGNVAPFITDYGIGDYVRVKIVGYSMLPINTMLRLEKYELTIDDNDDEQVKVYLS